MSDDLWSLLLPSPPPRKRPGGRLRTKPYDPIRAHVPKDVWVPELIGLVNRYPKSQAEFDRRKESGRRVFESRLDSSGKDRKAPPGWGGKRKELSDARVTAQREALRFVEMLVANDALISDDEMAKAAIAAAFEIGTAHRVDDLTGERVYVYQTKDRLAALKTVAEFTKAKPVIRQQTSITTAEDFLAALTESSQTK